MSEPSNTPTPQPTDAELKKIRAAQDEREEKIQEHIAEAKAEREHEKREEIA